MVVVAWPGLEAVRGWARSVERAWLGWSFPPVSQALAEACWRPDPPEAWCPRCGASVAPGEASRSGCAGCRGHRLPWEAFVRLGPYRGHLRDWILAIKYQRWEAMAEALGRELGRALAPWLGGGEGVVVPMPMPWLRRLYRGIDHARSIACGVGAQRDFNVAALLGRANGPPQVALGASRRARGGGGARLRRRFRGIGLEGLSVVLVDDVRTSGASLRRAAGLLRRLGPQRLVAAVLAVTDPPGMAEMPPAGPNGPGPDDDPRRPSPGPGNP